MKTIILFLLITNTLFAQSFNPETIQSEIEAAALKEQQAFKNGDCSTVLEMMEDDITFLANGRKVPSKTIIDKFCNSIPRPFKTPTIDKLDIYPLTDVAGYTIKTLEYPFDENTKIEEYVTKIWQKSDGKWRISHLHSTVKKVPLNKGAKRD